MKICRILAVLLCFLCLWGCAEQPAGEEALCQVVLEAGEGFSCDAPSLRTVRGSDVTFVLRVADGFAVTGADHGDYTLEKEGNVVRLTLHRVRYSVTVSVLVERNGGVLVYHANDGGTETVEVPVADTHLRWNTATDLFTRAGYTLTGWNTRSDGTGTAVGLGSRVEPEDGMVLYAQWSRWSGENLFIWEPSGDGAAITAYLGHEETVTVPGELGGLPVRSIAAGAFENCESATVILPDSLRIVENGAFRGAKLTTLYLFDNIRDISDHAFADCENLQTLHLNAVEAPVYSGSYYATFADKFDRLVSLAEEQKIVLFSGSSTRFGYDSARLDEAFSGFDVVNMGVFAYTNAAPQLEIILTCMGAGDILLHSPELDAAQRQFCTTDALDEPFFNMMEANYDMVALLDLRNYSKVFESLSAYLSTKADMEPASYGLSPADFDEDGNPVDTLSYNEYGDYILYRSNAETAEPVYGLEVPYTRAAYPRAMFIEPLNRMYQRFLDKGIRVYFAYSPRNALAVSADSTPEARAELDAYFRENLCVPVISGIEESLWSGIYLYGTDNHLSTEGVAIRTEQIIWALKAQLEKEGAS